MDLMLANSAALLPRYLALVEARLREHESELAAQEEPGAVPLHRTAQVIGLQAQVVAIQKTLADVLHRNPHLDVNVPRLGADGLPEPEGEILDPLDPRVDPELLQRRYEIVNEALKADLYPQWLREDGFLGPNELPPSLQLPDPPNFFASQDNSINSNGNQFAINIPSPAQSSSISPFAPSADFADQHPIANPRNNPNDNPNGNPNDNDSPLFPNDDAKFIPFSELPNPSSPGDHLTFTFDFSPADIAPSIPPSFPLPSSSSCSSSSSSSIPRPSFPAFSPAQKSTSTVSLLNLASAPSLRVSAVNIRAIRAIPYLPHRMTPAIAGIIAHRLDSLIARLSPPSTPKPALPPPPSSPTPKLLRSSFRTSHLAIPSFHPSSFSLQSPPVHHFALRI